MSLLLLDEARLQKARALTSAGDEVLAPAFEALRSDADKALGLAPCSVMDKTLTPPSGDKHDYLSLGPYWWPDPDRPDGKPYIRRDGETNPESASDATDRPAMSRMATAVVALAEAWTFTQHTPYADHAARLLRVWFLDDATRMHPHLEFGQAIPGRCDGRGIGIIDTSGLAKLCDAATLLRTSDAWTADDDAALSAWMNAYLAWLQTSAHGKDEASQHNNHGTWYDVQVAALALFTGQEDAARGVLKAAPAVRFATQIAPGGHQPHEIARTRSFDYSLFNLQAFFALARLGEHLGLDLWSWQDGEGRSLRAALAFLAPYADAHKPWPHEQLIPPMRGNLVPLLLEGCAHWPDAGFDAALRALPNEKLRSHRARLLGPQIQEGRAQ